MSTQEPPKSEHPSTYFVEDRSNQQEMARLLVQDRMLTAGMGGVLTEQADPASLRRVLDVGCGTGGWLVETAKAYPTISQLNGVDVSNLMLDFARTQAEAEGVSERVEFRQMDALRMLEFPNGFFDMVNQRLGISYVRTWDWPKLLQEFGRVTRSEGIIRITESNLGESNSAAQMQLGKVLLEAFYRSGHLFSAQADSVINRLPALLKQYGFQQVQMRASTLEYRAGTPEWTLFTEDMRQLYQTLLPFFRKWAQVPDNYQELYQQTLYDIQQPDFVATLRVLTVWGINP